jgi:alanyl-tRNA synthetase
MSLSRLQSDSARTKIAPYSRGTHMTQRLYYDDSYTHSFSARVSERLMVDNRPALVLDQTYFYPTSGGQPNDLGTIENVGVIDVFTRAEDAAVVHLLEQPVEADVVDCQVDWNRRFDHMQHHTGQHILSQAFVQVAQANTVGFHLSQESVTIDLNRTGLEPSVVARVEDLANQIIFEDRPVTARLVKAEDAEGVRIRKLPEHLLTDGLRVIDIDGFDVTACGGTHVSRSGEIGLIKILRVDKRGDKSRVEFRCGARALHDYRAKNALVYHLMSALTCGMDELPQAVQRLQDSLKTLQSDLKSARQQLLEDEAARLIAAAPERGGIRLIKTAFEGREATEIRMLASRLTQTPGVVALLGAAGARLDLVFARSADLPQDMNALLRQALTLLDNGRGGGQPALAQGSGTGTLAQLQAALDEAEQNIIS